MTSEEQAVEFIKSVIAELPAEDQEAIEEVAEHIRRVVRVAGNPVGFHALALVRSEAAAGIK